MLRVFYEWFGSVEVSKSLKRCVMTESEIRKVMSGLPGLNAFGVGSYFGDRKLTPKERREKLASDERRLVKSGRECALCGMWLSIRRKRVTINTKWGGSYGLKHDVERDVGKYISNGSLIAAAIHCGFNYRLEGSGPNVDFAISKRLTEPTVRENDGHRLLRAIAKDENDRLAKSAFRDWVEDYF